MKSVRTYWADDQRETPNIVRLDVVRLDVVPRNAPPRPRWGYLYLALLVVGALGSGAHFAVPDPWMVTAVDAVFGLGLVAVLAGWIRLNRIALARLDEPDAAAVGDVVAVRELAERPRSGVRRRMSATTRRS